MNGGYALRSVGHKALATTIQKYVQIFDPQNFEPPFCDIDCKKLYLHQVIRHNDMTKRKVWIGIVVAVALVGIALFYIFDPATTPFPRCPFLVLTGWQCPGCGSQRAIHSLLHLDLAAAWRYNAFLVLSIPYILMLLLSEHFGRRREGRFNRILNSEVMIWGYFVLVIAWWLLRNIFNW